MTKPTTRSRAASVTNWVVNESAIDFSAPLVFVIAELASADAAR